MSTTATCWEDVYRVQTARIAELERENAKLRCDVYQCPPTSENSYEGLKWSDACAELERENDELNATLDAIIAADERAVTLWRAAHPGNELVIPDRGKLVGWLLEQNTALRADKERLDWLLKLEETERVKFCRGWYRWTTEEVKAAIDAGRKEAQP